MTPFVRAYEREHLRVHRSPVGCRRLRVVGLAESRADQAPKRSALQTSAYARRGLKPLSTAIPTAPSSSSFFPHHHTTNYYISLFTTSFFLVVGTLRRFLKNKKTTFGLRRCGPVVSSIWPLEIWDIGMTRGGERV